MSARTTLAVLASGFVLAACASNVSMLQLGSMPPGVTMDARVHYYDVSAASLNELRRGNPKMSPALLTTRCRVRLAPLIARIP